MALSPTDFYAYSRATGTPYPESPEERAQIAPQVLDFRRNQLTAPSQPQSQGVDPLSMGVGIGLGLAGLGTGLGIRRMLGRGKQVPKSTSRSANAGVRQVDLSRQIEEVVTRGRASTTEPAPAARPTPQVEDPWTTVGDVPVSKAPDLVDIQQNQRPLLAAQQNQANDTGLDQTIQNINAFSQRDTDSVKQGGYVSAEDIPSAPGVDELKVSPNESVVSQLNKRKAIRQQVLNETRQSLGITADNAPLPEGFEIKLSPEQKAGQLAEQALSEVRERNQAFGPAPISQSYKEALFNVSPGGVLTLKPEIIAKNLGDPNVFPDQLSRELRDSLQASSSIGDLNSPDVAKQIQVSDQGVLQRATQHVMENLLKEDDANTVKDYLISGGELQTPATKGFGYTGTSGGSKTEVVTIVGPKGEEKIEVSGPKSSSRYTRSDLEPVYFDPITGGLIRKSEVGATKSTEGAAGTGIGAEIGQAVGFVPREAVEKFTTLPGLSPKEEVKFKGQGSDFSVGGLKEFGDTGVQQISPQAWQQIRQKRKELNLKPGETTPEIDKMLANARSADRDISLRQLPLFQDPAEAFNAGAIRVAKNNSFYLKVSPLMIQATPGIERFVEQQSGTLFVDPFTGRNFNSAADATQVYSILANNLNQKLIAPAQTRVDAMAKGENLNVQISRPNTSKVVSTSLNPNMVVDQIVKRDVKGETITVDVTLSQALRNQLLSPYVRDETGTIVRDSLTNMPLKSSPLIQEKRIVNDDGTPGALYYKQSLYAVPEGHTYLDTTTGERRNKMLGFGQRNLPLATDADERKAKNNFLFLEGVNNALEEITGQRVKVIDDAIAIGKLPDAEFMGGVNKNPVLNEALTVANSLVQTSEATRIKQLADEGLGDRYGLGARQSERPQRTIPSRQSIYSMPTQQVTTSQVTDPNTGELKTTTQLITTNQSRNIVVPPDVIAGNRLSAALVDYRARSGRPMRRQDFLAMANDVATQEGADLNKTIQQALKASRGAGQQAIAGKLMSQGRRALSALDRPSPAEEIAQTISEYDFGETIGDDLERLVSASRASVEDPELSARQAQRAQVDPPGLNQEEFGDYENLSTQVNKLMAQSRRRKGSRNR